MTRSIIGPDGYIIIHQYYGRAQHKQVEILRTVKCGVGLCGQHAPVIPPTTNTGRAFTSGFSSGFR